ncbi:MAG: GAF domain-containing protein [Candidatus Marinimicrobia bacterium]|nr:GAF domain-containing protein [Candidatus Neomarinimicrobiota bacterium]
MTATVDIGLRLQAGKLSAKVSQLLLMVNNDMALTDSLDVALEKLVSIITNTLGAERATIFLNDHETGELYSRVAQGSFMREIRIMNTRGIAGWVFTHEEGAIVHDAYRDKRFFKNVDMRTGYRTKSILCAVFRDAAGKKIGVSQVLNKIDGRFTEQDLDLLMMITQQAAIAIQNHLILEEVDKVRKQELDFLDVVSQISSELELEPLLQKIISTVTSMLNAERSSLFINDEKTNELYTIVGEGLGANEIRFPNHLGIAGHVFQTGEVLNIPHAYADLRFNPAFDKQTGFFTRSMLCIPVTNKAGKTIGVSQVLNKHGGAFTQEDEARLAAFTSQISIGIENATLFKNVQQLMNYTESMLHSMTNGVITFNDEHKVATCNPAGLRIMRIETEEDIVGRELTSVFAAENEWVRAKLQDVQEVEVLMDAELVFAGETISANLTMVPLRDDEQQVLGSMIMIEDISSEKRVKSTMARYMDATLADQLLEGGEDILGGKQSIGTVLFSDIRSFTTLTEQLGAQGTVSLLNEYFTIMVDIIQDEGGMLDKFIGDAMMVVFGTPVTHDDDPDRALRSAIKMMTELWVLNESRKSRGMAAIDHGMGLNTGDIVSGNIGSPKRMDYTVIGDGVNLAARLESACKKYGAHILLSEYTFASLKATYRTRHVDKVIVKGKTEPVGVYEAVDYHDKTSFPNMIDVLGYFNGGIELYNEARWDEAVKQFKLALKGHPGDAVSKMYVERCAELKASPPKGDWDGVWVFTSK